ncbi:hypothetical protein SAMN05216567_111125 [Variovorax sp. OK605]|jgi:hypothetical protein|uniref:hypothetical protein n=1 Tax=unclassified Variovorax TaxID=663243 RepID=UPI0008C9BC51|nr:MULTISPECIES: hypothetical protein [unclassified Variovorax]SEK10121.1 hypothetical protein SAMN05518853_109130 [Variovorax sp. OK202]SFD66573.1 hypothetical protein SAMN05444746_109130 [Variovorax sp. OK212]SFQ12379.1 hypothetical protein SAMN05216567_111125 [Variovorax sp. OK605]
MAASNNPSEIIAKAQALIDQAQQSVASSEQFFRDQGLNPEKVRTVLEGQMTARHHEEANAAFKADMDAVEQETREEQARASFNAAPTGTAPRRPRPMV